MILIAVSYTHLGLDLKLDKYIPSIFKHNFIRLKHLLQLKFLTNKLYNNPKIPPKVLMTQLASRSLQTYQEYSTSAIRHARDKVMAGLSKTSY